eukprot:Pgem_evm1s11641
MQQPGPPTPQQPGLGPSNPTPQQQQMINQQRQRDEARERSLQLQRESHIRKAPSSGLFQYTVLSSVDDVDKAWAPRYQDLQQIIEEKSDAEAKQVLVSK